MSSFVIKACKCRHAPFVFCCKTQLSDDDQWNCSWGKPCKHSAAAAVPVNLMTRSCPAGKSHCIDRTLLHCRIADHCRIAGGSKLMHQSGISPLEGAPCADSNQKSTLADAFQSHERRPINLREKQIFNVRTVLLQAQKLCNGGRAAVPAVVGLSTP